MCPGRYFCRALGVHPESQTCLWSVLCGPHAERLIKTPLCGHPAEQAVTGPFRPTIRDHCPEAETWVTIPPYTAS